MMYYTPPVTSTGGRAGRVRSADGILDLELAVATELGGPGGQANPEELFAAAYAACFHSAVKRIAAEQNVIIGHSSVDAHVSLGVEGDDLHDALAAALHVTLPKADVSSATLVVCLARVVCPYSRATRDTIALTLTVTPADGKHYDVTQTVC